MKSIVIRIRKARLSDLPDLARLLAELFSIEQDFVVNARRQRRGLKLILSAPNEWRVFVAEGGGRVVGMCSVHRLVSTAEGAESALIEDMVVRKGWRGKGVGRKLLAAAETWSFAQGFRRLQLLADRDNKKALLFYRRNGWSRTHLICLRKSRPRRGRPSGCKPTES